MISVTACASSTDPRTDKIWWATNSTVIPAETHPMPATSFAGIW